MAERLFSLETEYPSVVRASNGKGMNRNDYVIRALNLAERKFPCLKGRDSAGLFLANGSRLYVDCTSFLEVALPECTSPWEVVRYTQAGERMLAGLAAEIVGQSEGAIGEMAFYRINVDYTGVETTWGCHENYMHRCADLSRLYAQLLPHLASRVIYVGPGGFNPRCRGLEFTLSPRGAHHLITEVSDSSTSGRGMIHTKQESLASLGSGCRRLHLICGESLCSETAAWLKVGTTALIVALIEAGLSPGSAVGLASPLVALRTFAKDETCTATVPGDRAGVRWSAMAIQRHYLEEAEAHAHDSFMPPWADEVCRRWRAILDLLQAGAPDSVANVLDWAIKRVVYGDVVQRRGIAWEALPHYNHALTRIMSALDQTPLRGQPCSMDFLLGPASPIADEMKALGVFLQSKQIPWDSFRAYLGLRAELLEAEWRFGEIGPRSVFHALDQAGVLSHRVPGVENIEHAVENPPPIGRARVRGECIRRLSGQNGRYAAEWQSVTDRLEGRLLDLSDPFASEERWVEAHAGVVNRSGVLGSAVQQLLASLRTDHLPPRTPDGYHVGERVVLGRHDPVNNDENWCAEMAPYVGRPATIVAITGRDLAGCFTVRVDVDGARWNWRTRNLRRPPST